MLKDLSCSLPGSAEPQLSQRKDLIKSMAERKDVVMSSMSTDDDEEEEDEKPRTVHANKPEEHEEDDYDGNEITTSRYTWYTFLPVNLFIQFQRAANAYFLVLLILQLIPVISSLNPISTVVPLVLVLSATGVKDAYDDIIRHRSDREINQRKAQVLGRTEVQWQEVRVGDILEVKNNDFIAADLLLLSSSEENDLCYLETAELDGETNLKLRQALPETAAEKGHLEKFDGIVVCEPPNNKLDKFDGRLEWREKVYSLNNDNMLLRGCRLRNTKVIHGLVIFAGHDSKLMQNSGKSVFKRTGLDRLMNVLVILIFFVLGSLSIVCAVASSIWELRKGNDFQVYVPWELDSSHAIAALGFFSYIIVMNTLVPISLYVSVEIIRLGLSWLVDWDAKMYHAETDTPAKARTTTLSEELGQIEYIFSDKTGTLTQNVMTFHMCSIGGHVYGDVTLPEGVPDNWTPKRVDFSANKYSNPDFVFYDEELLKSCKDCDQDVLEFFRLIALCHTVMPELDESNKIQYQAQSPDEGALVSAAASFGITFLKRSQTDVTLDVNGKEEKYEMLCILDFDNVRKRMSVIVRGPNDSKKIQILCKGADSAIFEKLAPEMNEKKEEVLEHLQHFATNGLRTLCLGSRELREEEWESWSKKYHEASTSTQNRDEKLSCLYEEIESDFNLLGATAVEDKLQDGVPETIARLAQASIKIWVLTGDKEETAINIGYSSHLLRADMEEPFIMKGSDKETVEACLKQFYEKICEALRKARGLSKGEDVVDAPVDSSGFEPDVDMTDGKGEPEFSLVINGFSLVHALEDDLRDLFFRTATLCKAVICCRVTPLQKAKVVGLVKEKQNAVTLAIGDGANDVSMIKAAHIGVGISGKEGRQAVLSSDYSLAQFRFLERLLLVHGRWSYMRMAKFLSYFFYKNFAFTLVQFWYAWFCGFSAQTVYDDWFITFYNVIFTSLPVLAIGIFDQDVPDDVSLKYPKLYVPGQQNRLFNKRVFARNLLNGALVSSGLFFIGYGFFNGAVDSEGKDAAGLDAFGDSLAGTLVFVVNIQIGLETFYWTWISHLFTWGSIAAWFLFMFVLYGPGLSSLFPSVFPSGAVAPFVCGLPQFWLFLLLSVGLFVGISVTVNYLLSLVNPSLTDLIRKQYGFKCYGYRGVEVDVQKEDEEKGSPSVYGGVDQRTSRSASMSPGLTRSATVKSTGYAFSQEPGFGRMIMDGKLSYVDVGSEGEDGNEDTTVAEEESEREESESDLHKPVDT
eukprot:m.100197 g.100197  ORF g.100197 m.100197 type:complete len:1253 (+) comp37085_c0_seq9:5030-8788(+)